MASQQGLMMSELPILQTVSGEEYVEVIHREGTGPYDNYRVLVSKIRDVSTAYDFAVSNGFAGTLAEWLACTQAIYARDATKFGKVLVADNQGVGQWTEISGLVDGLEAEFNQILLQAQSAATAAAASAGASDTSADAAAASVTAATAAKDTAQGFAGDAQSSVAQANAAREAAESAVTTTQGLVTQAGAARDAGEGFATAAAASATEAQDFAQAASISRNAAEAAVGQAQLAVATVEEIVTDVTASVDAAAQSATTAQTAAAQAIAAKDATVPLAAAVETSVAQAAASKDAAAVSATTATDSALAAIAAKNTTEAFANAAGASADEASNAATAADLAKDDAATSVTTAQALVVEAQDARDASETAAASAASSATETQTATLQAVNAKDAAGVSAGQAQQSALDAEAAATTAVAAAEEATLAAATAVAAAEEATTGGATSAQGAKADTALQPADLGVTVASLVAGMVPSSQLPSYVDDVLDYATFATLPATGEAGKIYVTATPYTSGEVTSSQFRWSGSAYVPIIASPGTTDAVTEGSVNLYHTAVRVMATLLSGFSTATATPVTDADSVLSALGKLQAQIALNMTNPMTAAGDMIFGGVAGVPSRLAKGTDGQGLVLVAGQPAWVTPPSYVSQATYDAAMGDIAAALAAILG
ncbi:hypothetical protein D3C85_444830 [compost metagenome]